MRDSERIQELHPAISTALMQNVPEPTAKCQVLFSLPKLLVRQDSLWLFQGPGF